MSASLPGLCLLGHAVFSALGEVTFRRAATDGTPVMIVPMGELEASVPLRSLQREFAIGDDSDDGRMLGLIAESLDYVSLLQLGDPLPAEVLTGMASWEPADIDRSRVADRMRDKLLAWLDPEHTNRSLDDSRQQSMVQAAFDRAARELGLAARADVIVLFEKLCEELAFIEALRRRLLDRVTGLSARLNRLGGRQADGERTQMLIQVQRLTEIALGTVRARFDEVDGQTGEIMAALRNAEGSQAFIRSNRDWLYRCQRAWEQPLAQWDDAGRVLDPKMWDLVGATYRFLAPRYMPSQEWGRAQGPRAAKKKVSGMAWS